MTLVIRKLFTEAGVSRKEYDRVRHVTHPSDQHSFIQASAEVPPPFGFHVNQAVSQRFKN